MLIVIVIYIQNDTPELTDLKELRNSVSVQNQWFIAQSRDISHAIIKVNV